MDVTISPVRDLPEDFEFLVEDSAAEGHRFLLRLRDEWASGRNRFSLPGEVLLEARASGKIVGVGGLNRDPYIAAESTGRIRRLYVARSHRRQGLGRAIIEGLLVHARGRFAVVRLRTHDPDAAAFYEALGFRRVDGDPHATHRMEDCS